LTTRSMKGCTSSTPSTCMPLPSRGMKHCVILYPVRG
jgi:hypothetical protein